MWVKYFRTGNAAKMRSLEIQLFLQDINAIKRANGRFWLSHASLLLLKKNLTFVFFNLKRNLNSVTYSDLPNLQSYKKILI